MRRKNLVLHVAAAAFESYTEARTINFNNEPQCEIINAHLKAAGVAYATPVHLSVVEKYHPLFAGHVLFTLQSQINTVADIVRLMVLDNEDDANIQSFLTIVKENVYGYQRKDSGTVV